MKPSGRAWLLLPAIIVVVVVMGLLLSNWQKEAGLAEPSKAGRSAVSAAGVAIELSSGTDAREYARFSNAVLVAAVAKRNAPLLNPADTRLNHQLTLLLDCLFAAREAWQAQIDETWDPGIHGTSTYWSVTHPSAGIAGEDLTAAKVRELSLARAHEILRQAADLAD